MTVKYDNCKNCQSKCEHAGKDREFVCVNGVSCRKTKQTNADRIRNMTDEELADFVSSGEVSAICPECDFYGKEGLCYLDDESGETEKNCSEGILKWLQSEVEEGE